VIALVRYALADGVRSQRILPPAVVFGSVLAVLYAIGPSAAVSSYGATSLVLFPVAAWCAAALLGSEDPVQWQVTAVHARGTRRAALAKILAAVVLVTALAAVAVLLPWLFGALKMPVPGGEGLAGGGLAALPYLGIGLLAHLAAGLPGVGIAAVWSPPAVRRVATTLAGIVVCLILTVPLDDLRNAHVAAARLLPLAVPPFEVVRRMLDGRVPATILTGLGPALAGAVLFTVLASTVYVTAARRRS
jgi:hypothetical protein